MIFVCGDILLISDLFFTKDIGGDIENRCMLRGNINIKTRKHIKTLLSQSVAKKLYITRFNVYI